MNASIDELIELYSRKLAGDILSPAEENLLQDWKAGRFEDVPIVEKDLEAMLWFEGRKWRAWANLPQKEAPIRSNRKVLWWLAAALVTGLIGLLVFWPINRTKPSPAPLVAIHQNPAQDTMASIKLSNGSLIHLSKRSSGLIAEEGPVQLTIPTPGTLHYVPSPTHHLIKEPGYNTIQVPPGANLSISLPDGSKVALNAASSIRFPLVFTGKERRVQVTGEAFFEVRKETHRPFIVQTQQTSIRVMGTSFNVKSYANQPAIYITLVAGKVAVDIPGQSMSLLPGEQVIVDEKKIKKTSTTDVEAVLAWKHGYFQYTNVDVRSIVKDIARWYMLEEVEYKGANPGTEFVIEQIPKDWPLQRVLNVLQKTGDFHFQLEGRKLTVLE